jgi:hypothetical protein
MERNYISKRGGQYLSVRGGVSVAANRLNGEIILSSIQTDEGRLSCGSCDLDFKFSFFARF